MTGAARLGLFAGAALAVAAIGAGVGWALPELRGGVDGHGHSADHDGASDRTEGAGHADHGAGSDDDHHGGHGVSDTAAVPAGLAVTDRGLTLAPDRVRLAAGGDRFAFRVLDPGGRAVTDFDLAHERRMHLIVVRRDLGHYLHVHPTMAADGTWSVRLDLPAGGVYRAYADLAHAGLATTLGTDLFVDGPLRAAPLPGASPVARGDGYRARLVVRDADGGLEALTYAVERDGAPATGITPHLGAAAHVVAIREGDMAYVHAHAADPAPPGDRLQLVMEPPSPGRYRVFIQFMHDGAVRTVAHTLAVER